MVCWLLKPWWQVNFIQNGTTAFPMSLYLIVQLVAFHIYDSTIVITRRSNWNCREITLPTIFASRYVDSDRAQIIKIGPFNFLLNRYDRWWAKNLWMMWTYPLGECRSVLTRCVWALYVKPPTHISSRLIIDFVNIPLTYSLVHGYVSYYF